MIKKLNNGVTLLFEKNPNIRSATLGIWVKTGSRNEPLELNGISHFIEHMLFKGTKKRNSIQISKDLDAIGGQMNAFTTKECTCYYVKALDIHLSQAIEIISDMFLNSVFDPKDVKLERTVIEEEIAMYEDQPDDVVMETIGEIVYGSSMLAKPVLGTYETLDNINSNELIKFKEKNYVASNTVISITGSFSDTHIEEICEVFGSMMDGTPNEIDKASYKPCKKFIEKDIAQNHICIAFEGIENASEDRYALNILNNVLGSGMSSRLFQKVREEYGLCYTISSFNISSIDTGIFVIYLATSNETQKKAIDLIKEVLVEFVKNGISEEELLLMREQIKANVIMGLESNTSRMHYLARAVLFDKPILTEDEIIDAYDKVTREDVLTLARKIIDFDKTSWCIVGDVAEKNIF